MLRQKEILLFPKKTHAPRSLDSVKDRVAACVFFCLIFQKKKGCLLFCLLSQINKINKTKSLCTF